MNQPEGYKIVLTASDVEMSNYRDNPFLAFSGSFSYRIPIWTTKNIMWSTVPLNKNHLSSSLAPYGLRKIEASLLNHGFKKEDIITVQAKQLKNVIGSETKILAISSMDPLGLAYVSFTYGKFIGFGEISCTSYYFQKIFHQKILKKFRPRIIVGGQGAWQLGKTARKRLGIDHIILGEADAASGEIFNKIIEGKKLPEVIEIKISPKIEEISPIVSPSIHGTVEISRGCGRMCQFCTPTMHKKRDIPLKQIIQEVKVNVENGQKLITLATEDALIYRCKMDGKFIPNASEVLNLFKSITSVPGVEAVQPAHISLTPVVINPKLIADLSEVLADYCRYKYNHRPLISAETGIETGSVRLMEKYLRGKSLPFEPEKWPEIIRESIGILEDNNWGLVGTLLIGLPDETEDDTLETLELIDDLFKTRVFFVPLLFANLHECVLKNERRANFNELSNPQLEFFLRCWEHNLHLWKNTWLNPLENNRAFNLVHKLVSKFVFTAAYLLYYRWGKDSLSRIKQELIKEVIDAQPIQTIRNGIRNLKSELIH
ncbi:MAG: B12-binding domain-containing radical SAM protein [Promethearchaeota archaeon]